MVVPSSSELIDVISYTTSPTIHQLAFVLLCCLFVVYDLCHFCVLLKQIWVISLIEIRGTRAAWLEIFCISIN